jgi:two-component system, NtrC family, response regulator AtoC
MMMKLFPGRGDIMPATQEKISLLLVDDERDFLDAAAAALSRRGFDVDTARSGERAVEMMKQKCPDVIVLDVKMPGIDGVQLFHRLNLVYPDIPVILLTGHGTVQQAFETSKRGVFEYLTKPCDIDDLACVVRRAHQGRS